MADMLPMELLVNIVLDSQIIWLSWCQVLDIGYHELWHKGDLHCGCVHSIVKSDGDILWLVNAWAQK